MLCATWHCPHVSTDLIVAPTGRAGHSHLRGVNQYSAKIIYVGQCRAGNDLIADPSEIAMRIVAGERLVGIWSFGQCIRAL